MQILMADTAYERVKDRLPAGLDILTFAKDGIRREGKLVNDADPEFFWVSADLFLSGQLGPFFAHMTNGTKGQWAQIPFAGIDNPAFKAVMAKGIRLTKSDAQAPTIAEFVVAHAISLLHPIAEQAAAQRAHEWKRIPFREIASSHVVLVGYGNIGSRIAERFRPFGPRISVVRREAGVSMLVDEMTTIDALPRLLPSADVVVLACALNDSTRHIANAAFFAALKKGAILLNIGRGDLIDEDALRTGLDRDQPGHAVLDVFHTEPLPADAWFWDHPKVRVTAHTSNAGDGVARRGDELFLDNLGRYLRGEPLRNEARKDEVGL